MGVLVCVWAGSGVYLIAADACTLPLEARHLTPRQSLRDDRKDQSPFSSFRLRMNQLVAVLCTLRTIEDTPIIILRLHITPHVSLPVSLPAVTSHARGSVSISRRTKEHIGAYEYAPVREEPRLSRRRMCTRREHTCSAHVLLHVGRAAGSIIHCGDVPTHPCNEKRISFPKRFQSERIASDPITPFVLCTEHCQLCEASIRCCCSTNSYALKHFFQTRRRFLQLLNTSATRQHTAHVTLICNNLLTSLRPSEQFPIFALLLTIIARADNVALDIGVLARLTWRDQLTVGGVGTALAPRDALLGFASHVAALFDKSDAQCRLDFDSVSGLLIRKYVRIAHLLKLCTFTKYDVSE